MAVCQTDSQSRKGISAMVLPHSLPPYQAWITLGTSGSQGVLIGAKICRTTVCVGIGACDRGDEGVEMSRKIH